MQLSDLIGRTLGAGLALALLAPAAAYANTTRYAASGASPAAACTSGDPCRVDVAVNGASDGDEVIVAPGTYGSITVPLDAPKIVLHGEAGKPAPVLIGDTNLAGDLLTLRRGGTVRHLELVADSPSKVALHLDEGVAEDLRIRAVTGDAAHVYTAGTTTLLRDSVVVAEGGGSSADALVLLEGTGGSSSLAVRNVVASSATDAAILCQAGTGHAATIANVIARGVTKDVDFTSGSGCSVSHSNLRPIQSPAVASLSPGIQSAEPKLGADWRPAPGAPGLDAGIADAYTSGADPDGKPRTVPDIGVFEGEPKPKAGDEGAPTPGTPVEPAIEPPVRGVPAPVLGNTVVVAPGKGTVLVRRPGTRRFRRLAGAKLLPTGTVVDARRGSIRLTTALGERGEFQTGRFGGSRFQVRQGHTAGGMTSLTLRGGNFGRCPARSSALAHTSMVPRENATTRRVVRRLWARDRGGRFRTYGNNSVATARGTVWTTEDRCDGTIVRVREGAVAVKNRRTGKTVLVRAGRAHFTRR